MQNRTLILSMIFIFALVATINSTAIAKGHSFPPQKHQNLNEISAVLGDISCQLSTGMMTPQAQKTAAKTIQGISHSLHDRAGLGNEIHHTHQANIQKMKKYWSRNPFPEESATHD